MAERPYRITNIVGDSRTRMHRANAPMTQRCKLWVAGRRMIPGDTIPLKEETFLKFAAKIRDMVLEGKVVVTTPEGTKITSKWTGEFVLTRADGALKLLPKGELPECFKLTQLAPEPTPEPTPELAPEPEPTPAEPPVEVPELLPEPEPSTEVMASSESEAETEPGLKKHKKRR